MEFGFFLKQFISFFIQPFGAFLTLFTVGIFFLMMKKDKKMKLFIILTYGVIFLFSYQPFSNYLVKNLEDKYPKYDYKQKVKYIHVLGGGDGQRVIAGIIIHNKIEGSKLIFTGYAGGADITTTRRNELLALSLGVKKEDIILGVHAKDTKEEAIFNKELLKNEPFILVTTATHMPRAMKIFKNLGLNPIPAPVNFHKEEFNAFFRLPTLGSLGNSQISMHEYMGTLWEKIKHLML